MSHCPPPSLAARDPRTGGRAGHLATGVCVATLALLAACQGERPVPTAPSVSATSLTPSDASAAARPPKGDLVSSVLPNTPGACLLAVRSEDGRYPSRQFTIRLPARFTSSRASATRFAYRGWAAGVPEPTLLAICTMPDAQGAREYFAAQFESRELTAAGLRTFVQLAGAVGAEGWTSPHIMQGAGPAYVTDGLASEFRAVVTRTAQSGGFTTLSVCDPSAIIPEPGCEPPPDGGGATAPRRVIQA
jgi:hypothetical protein